MSTLIGSKIKKKSKIWSSKSKGIRKDRVKSFSWSDQRFDKAFTLDVSLPPDATGLIWKGRHIESGTEVCIKKIDHFVDHYVTIATPLQMRLRHPCIVRYYGTVPVSRLTNSEGDTGLSESAWQVSEYFAFGRLSDLLIRLQSSRSHLNWRCTEGEVAALMVPVLRGLAYLQDQSLVHGMICPASVYIDASGRVKLGGIGEISFPELRSKNSTTGSDWPWPPERALGAAEEVTSKWDIWDCGLCFLELAGKANFESTQNDSFSPEFVGLVECCLLQKPVQRPRAAELLMHPFCVQASKTLDLVDVVLKFCQSLVVLPMAPVPEDRPMPSSFRPDQQLPSPVFQSLVEENQKLRDEIKSLTILREESAYLIRELIEELSQVKAQSSVLEKALMAILEHHQESHPPQ